MAILKSGFERFDDQPGSRAESVRAAVSARLPVDARERESIATFLAEFDLLVAAGSDPFDEQAGPVHVTASAIATSDAGVVLHLHKRLGIWLQPGGHIDHGEQPWEAARRETTEETGLPVAPAGDRAGDSGGDPGQLLHVYVHPGPRGHTHLDLRYLFTSPPVEPSPPEGESPDARWFTWAEAIGIADPGLEGVLRAAQPGRPTIRPAQPTDAPNCARVYLRSKAFAIPEVPEPHTEADIATWMGDVAIPTMDVWVADVDGVVVGQMMLDRARHGVITSLHRPVVDGEDSATSSGAPANAIPTGCSCGLSRATSAAGSTSVTASSPPSSPTAAAANWPDVRYTGSCTA